MTSVLLVLRPVLVHTELPCQDGSWKKDKDKKLNLSERDVEKLCFCVVLWP